MRIAIDIRQADAESPGQQRYLWRLGSWLAGRGHDVHFPTLLPQREGVVAPAGTTLHALHGASPPALRDAIADLRLDVLLLNPERSRDWRAIRPNVLRSAYGTEQYSQKLRSFREPMERALRTLWWSAPWNAHQRQWERDFYEDRTPRPEVIAQSGYMRDEILSSYRIPAPNVHVIPNAIDPSEFSPVRRAEARDRARSEWGIPHDRLCLLFVGHNFRLKGLWQLMALVPRIEREIGPVHLLVAGRGTGRGQRRKAARLARRYGIADRVTLAGSVYPPLPAYAASDVLLHLSWHDSFGFVALEGMACGLPVVTTPWVGAAERIENGTSGYVVDPESPETVAAALRELSLPTVRSRIGEAAAAAAARFDEESNFQEVERVFAIAAEKNRVPIAHD